MENLVITDIIQIVAILISTFFSVISLFLSNKAIRISKESIDEQKKSIKTDIIFAENYTVCDKSIEELKKSKVIDFDGLIFKPEERKLKCITIKLKNIGQRTINGINITEFYIQQGNCTSVDSRSQECNPVLYMPRGSYNLCNLGLRSGSIEEINILLNEDNPKYKIEEYMDKEQIMIGISGTIKSDDGTEFAIKDFMGCYEEKEIYESHYEKIDLVRKRNRFFLSNKR